MGAWAGDREACRLELAGGEGEKHEVQLRENRGESRAPQGELLPEQRHQRDRAKGTVGVPVRVWHGGYSKRELLRGLSPRWEREPETESATH